MGSRPSISAIMPIFNEQQTVGLVVEALLRCASIAEVVCVDDGSSDASLEILRGYGGRIELVALQPNRGKGSALAAGIRRAGGEIVAFFDADLVNLSEAHVEALLAPIRDGTRRAVLGNGTGTSVFSAVAAQLVGGRFTGERAYYRQDLLAHLPRMEAARFGVEVYLNGLFARADTCVVTLPGLTSLGKPDKHGWSVGLQEYSGEVLEVTRELARSSLSRFAG